MNPMPTEAELIEHALAAIEQLLARDQDDLRVPFYGPTDLAALPAEKQEALQSAEESSYRERPAQSALHFCLLSASALLDVSRSLVNRAANPTPLEREREWKALAAQTKIAGRSAYRAALILMDPTLPGPGLQASRATAP